MKQVAFGFCPGLTEKNRDPISALRPRPSVFLATTPGALGVLLLPLLVPIRQDPLAIVSPLEVGRVVQGRR